MLLFLAIRSSSQLCHSVISDTQPFRSFQSFDTKMKILSFCHSVRSVGSVISAIQSFWQASQDEMHAKSLLPSLMSSRPKRRCLSSLPFSPAANMFFGRVFRICLSHDKECLSNRSSSFSLVNTFGHSIIRSFIHSVSRSIVRPFGHSVIRSFIRSFGHSSSHSFIYSVIRSSIHSVTCSLD